MLIIAVTFVTHEEHHAAFVDAVLQNAATSLDLEEGCVVFDVCEDSIRNEVFLYEQYADDHAFDEVHLKSSHFVEFNKLTMPWVAEKHVRRYQLLTLKTESSL
jgi:autoinducer 2-degrading protein